MPQLIHELQHSKDEEENDEEGAPGHRNRPLVRLGAFVGAFWCIPTKEAGEEGIPHKHRHRNWWAREAPQMETHAQKSRRHFFNLFSLKVLVRLCAYRIIKIAVFFCDGHLHQGAFSCINPILYPAQYKKRWCVFVRIFAMAKSNALLIFQLTGAFV